MAEVSKLRMLYNYVNYIRTLPVALCIRGSAHREVIGQDFDRWRDILAGEMDDFSLKHRFTALNWLLLNKPE